MTCSVDIHWLPPTFQHATQAKFAFVLSSPSTHWLQYVLQLELLHDGKGVTENELRFKPFGAHLGLDGHIRGGGVRTSYSFTLSQPTGVLRSIVGKNSWTNRHAEDCCEQFCATKTIWRSTRYCVSRSCTHLLGTKLLC